MKEKRKIIGKEEKTERGREGGKEKEKEMGSGREGAKEGEEEGNGKRKGETKDKLFGFWQV